MNKLKEMRLKSGITQVQLAEKVGISQNYLSQLEIGRKNNASLDVIKRIAKALDCKVDELIA